MIDLTALWAEILPLLGAAVMALLVVGARRVFRLLGIQENAANTALLDMVLQRAVGYGIEKLRAEFIAGKLDHVDIKNEFLRLSLDYAQRSVPDLLRREGIGPARLREIIEGELGRQKADVETLVTVPAPDEAGVIR